VEKNVPFLETEASKESAEKPKQQTFESNANSLAASERPATGDLPLPSQDGKDKPALDLQTQNYSLPLEGTTPQPQQTPPPEKKPSEPPKPSASPAVTPEPDQLAMLTSTPPPPIKAPDETDPTPTPEVAPVTTPVPRPQPLKPASDYQAQKQQTRIQGSISTHGPSSVNAIGTPLGRYQKQMYDAVGARWYQYMERRRDVIGIGTARLTFSIDRSGRVTNLRVLENTANEAFASVCLQSVQELKLPPIPEDVASTLPAEGLQAELTFISYAN
jgi:protein TonB